MCLVLTIDDYALSCRSHNVPLNCHRVREKISNLCRNATVFTSCEWASQKNKGPPSLATHPFESWELKFKLLFQTAIGSEMTHLSSGNPRRNSEDKMYILCCPLPAACLLSRKIAFFKSRIEVDFRESLPLPLLLPLPHFQRRCEQGKL